MDIRWRGVVVLCASIGALASFERTAHAVNCSTLSNPLVIESGDTQEPLLKSVGRKLRDSTVNPMTLIYLLTGSCTLIDDKFNGRSLAQNAVVSYVPSTAENPSWTPGQPSSQCTIDAAGGLPIDVAISALFVSGCTMNPTPSGLGLFQGPIQGYTFIVPKASSQTAIVAEEAYFTFGFGQAGQAQPWIDETLMFIRPPTKSTILTMAAAIHVPATKWHGVPEDKSTQVLNLVATSPNPEATIGILGAEVYDTARNKLTVLAYRAYQQRYAYFPDSTATSFDKQNVRDGHYLPWSPTVYITAVDTNNVPTNANAKYLIDLILGNAITPAPDVDGLASVIGVGLVPDCAMRVSRQIDGGDLSLYSPTEPCGCFYDSKVPQGASSCTTCTTDGPCGAGKCRHGYCEAQ
jgi:hypothetical protein